MATVAEHPKDFVQQKLNEKEKIVEYIKSGDESKRPAKTRFAAIIPVSACSEGNK